MGSDYEWDEPEIHDHESDDELLEEYDSSEDDEDDEEDDEFEEDTYTSSGMQQLLKTPGLETLTLSDICREVASLPPSGGYRGMLFGSLTFSYDDGVTMDCRNTEIPIPQNIHLVGDMSSDARFILVVQKFAAYSSLVAYRLHDRFPSIIVRTKGLPPDVLTMLFLKRMETEFNLPVLALADSDPYVFKMLSAYGNGPKNITPDIRWLGMRPTDFERHFIPRACGLPMTDHDIKTAEDLLEDDFVKKNPAWVWELNLMLKTKQKLQIKELRRLGSSFFTRVYLPPNLYSKDWI